MIISPIDNKVLYAQRFQDKQNARKKKIWSTICKHFLQKYISSQSVVMDIAAGTCEFINAINAKEKIAIDVNNNIYDHVIGNITVINDSFFNLSNYTDKKCDVIFASNIFEHLNTKEEVISAIKICYQYLVPGGKLLILQPNIKFIGGAYWDFIDHKVPLTDKSLIEAGKLVGFTINKNILRFLPYSTKSFLPLNPFLVFLYLKMPFVWLFMGKQSFLVMEKGFDKS
jgi:SAM-dependent methyltransferase